MTERAPHPWSAERGRSFGRVADVYAATRPEYPEAAVRWVAGPGTHQVVDIGAGTGKLTRALVGAGYSVVAVEPLGEMLAHLDTEGVPAVAGTAEAIPLRSASCDAVYAGQAFHWFRTDDALREIGRVLRPGGRLGLLWNMLDTSVDWVAALAEVLHEQVPGQASMGDRLPFDSPIFTGLEYRQFAHPGHPLDLAGLLDLVRSRSYIATLSPDAHAAVLDRVTRLVREHPDVRDQQRFTLPYVTDVWRARKAAPR